MSQPMTPPIQIKIESSSLDELEVQLQRILYMLDRIESFLDRYPLIANIMVLGRKKNANK